MPSKTKVEAMHINQPLIERIFLHIAIPGGLGYYAVWFIFMLIEATGALQPWYIPYSIGQEFKRLMTEYAPLFFFPLIYLRPKIKWRIKWFHLAAPFMVLGIMAATCCSFGGNLFTPYLPFIWSNIAVMSWSAFFVIILYCYANLAKFTVTNSLTATIASLVLASWIYELFDPRLTISNYIFTQQNWAFSIILLMATFTVQKAKPHWTPWIPIGIATLFIAQIPYHLIPYLSNTGFLANPQVAFFWHTYDPLIRLTTLPFFIALILAFTSTP
jgi:hypothetical protein